MHNGKPVVESSVIVEYIDETWSSGTNILPADPLGKSNARFWAKFFDDKVQTEHNHVFMNVLLSN